MDQAAEPPHWNRCGCDVARTRNKSAVLTGGRRCRAAYRRSSALRAASDVQFARAPTTRVTHVGADGGTFLMMCVMSNASWTSCTIRGAAYLLRYRQLSPGLTSLVAAHAPETYQNYLASHADRVLSARGRRDSPRVLCLIRLRLAGGGSAMQIGVPGDPPRGRGDWRLR